MLGDSLGNKKFVKNNTTGIETQENNNNNTLTEKNTLGGSVFGSRSLRIRINLPDPYSKSSDPDLNPDSLSFYRKFS